jgi:DNA mismatch repair protein MutL
MGHISDYIVRTALAFPAIAFSLHGDKGLVHDFPSGGSIEERVKLLFGRETAGQLLAVEEEHSGLRLSGFITPPAVQRSSSSGLYLYVNGRFVRDKVLRHALLQGYESFIMKGKYPMALLFLEIDPSAVDVNVHPAKSEVKFRDSSQVHDLTRLAVSKTLQRRQWLGSAEKEAAGLIQNRAESIKDAASEYMAVNESLALKGGHTLREESPGYGQKQPRPDALPIKAEGETSSDNQDAENYFSSLDVIGQAGEMYIICEGREGIVLIDQHAAYERIAFETLKSGYNDKNYTSQNLLIPETVEITPKEAAALEENLSEINRLGFEIEPFGGNSFIVSAVPAILGARSVKTIIADMASELCEMGRSKTFDSALDDILKRIACHSVVRGRRRMSHEEMRGLLRKMDSSGIVPHCPHGRPAHIDITIAEIEKRFERA